MVERHNRHGSFRKHCCENPFYYKFLNFPPVNLSRNICVARDTRWFQSLSSRKVNTTWTSTLLWPLKPKHGSLRQFSFILLVVVFFVQTLLIPLANQGQHLRDYYKHLLYFVALNSVLELYYLSL